jgi:hypothetical protein
MPTFKTDVDVANAALSFLGEGPLSIPGLMAAAADPSDKVLTTLQQWYPSAWEQVMRDLDYEIAAEFITPVLLNNWPTPEWRAQYYLDPSWIDFVRVFSGAYPDSRETLVPHRKIRQGPTAALSITGCTIASPAVFSGVGAVNGQVVEVESVGGTLGGLLNGNLYFVGNATPTTFQLYTLQASNPLVYSPVSTFGNTNANPVNSTGYTYVQEPGAGITPIEVQTLLCNIIPIVGVQGIPLPMFEIGVVPDVSICPDDLIVAVATKLALLGGVGIVGIDRKAQVDALKPDYKAAKDNASANMANESFKGVRKMSASTMSRMTHRRHRGQGAIPWGSF